MIDSMSQYLSCVYSVTIRTQLIPAVYCLSCVHTTTCFFIVRASSVSLQLRTNCRLNKNKTRSVIWKAMHLAWRWHVSHERNVWWHEMCKAFGFLLARHQLHCVRVFFALSIALTMSDCRIIWNTEFERNVEGSGRVLLGGTSRSAFVTTEKNQGNGRYPGQKREKERERFLTTM